MWQPCLQIDMCVWVWNMYMKCVYECINVYLYLSTLMNMCLWIIKWICVLECEKKNIYIYIYIYISVYIIITLWEFFTPALADGLSLESEWQQVSSNLQDSSQYSGRS